MRKLTKREKVKVRKFLKPVISLFKENTHLSHEQRIIIKLVNQHITEKTAKLRIAPVSYSRYVENAGILIKISTYKLTVYHGTSKFDSYLHQTELDKIKKLFDVTAENSRISLEQAYLTPALNKLKKL